MGMKVELTLGEPEILVSAAVRRGLKAAGTLALAASDALAPREPEPRHGVHMTETGFVRNEIGPDGADRVAIGYEAFWSLFVHENLHDNHPHGGVAKFLELGLLEAQDAAWAEVAATVRQALTGE